VKWGKWLDSFLGGISCSAMVISSGARGLLTNVQAIVLSLPFDLGLATATNQMRIAVNENWAQECGATNFELITVSPACIRGERGNQEITARNVRVVMGGVHG
jgi:hypothetical protein